MKSVQWTTATEARTFKVMVCYEGVPNHGQLMVCVEIGFPEDVSIPEDIAHAANFALTAKLGEVAEFVPRNPAGRSLCLGGHVAFQCRAPYPKFLGPLGKLHMLPLVVGISHSAIAN